MLFINSIEEFKQLAVLIVIPALVLIFFITAAILIIRRINKRELPDNSLELQYAASINQKKTEVETETDPGITNYIKMNNEKNNTREDDITPAVKQQMDALEKEISEIKDELIFIQSNIGDGTEYREIKNKWHEKQEELLQLRTAHKKRTDIQTYTPKITVTTPEVNNTCKMNEVMQTINPQPATNNQIQELQEKNNSLLNELKMLKSENNSLNEQLANFHLMQHTTEEISTKKASEVQPAQTLVESEEEIKALRVKILELESLPEILKEKKLQIEFLQNQLDTRVKNSFHIEKEHSQLKDQLSLINETLKQMQEQSEQMHRDLQNKEQYITHINTQYKETLHSNEANKILLDEKCTALSALQAELNRTLQKLSACEEKLKINNEIFTQIYMQLQSIMRDESLESPMLVENLI